MATTLIATRFIADTPETATEYPAVGANSADPRFQEVYWRCIAAFFASSVRHNPNARHALFTNTTPPTIGRFDQSRFLASLGVEIVPLDITYRLPQGSVKTWGNVFYILDIIAHAVRTEAADRLVVLDSDCLWIRPIDQMAMAIDTQGLINCIRPYTDTHVNNGLTREDLKSAYEGFSGRSIDTIPLSCGGGVFAATLAECARVMETADRLWAYSLDQLRTGGQWLRTEEHLLSLASHHLGYRTPSANAFIDPIWTSFRHNTASPDDLDLTIWHLPAEKKTGFLRMFSEVMDERSAFWQTPTGDPFRRYAARAMGIPRRSAIKFLKDGWAKLAPNPC